MKKYKIIAIALCIFLSNNFSVSAEINPFIPKIMEPVINNNYHYIPPLKKWRLFQYNFIGTILSNEKSLALIRTPDGEIYRLTTGMQLGRRGDKIMDILIDRLILKNKKKERILILKNHEL